MARADEVMVQPVTTYMEGAEHKNERSDPYPVPRWHGEELKANGFARIVEEKQAAEPTAPAEPAKDAQEPPADTGERQRGRRGPARG